MEIKGPSVSFSVSLNANECLQVPKIICSY